MKLFNHELNSTQISKLFRYMSGITEVGGMVVLINDQLVLLETTIKASSNACETVSFTKDIEGMIVLGHWHTHINNYKPNMSKEDLADQQRTKLPEVIFTLNANNEIKAYTHMYMR